jgi:hypothetical protein
MLLLLVGGFCFLFSATHWQQQQLGLWLTSFLDTTLGRSG